MLPAVALATAAQTAHRVHAFCEQVFDKKGPQNDPNEQRVLGSAQGGSTHASRQASCVEREADAVFENSSGLLNLSSPEG
jgi:hypothetical protein